MRPVLVDERLPVDPLEAEVVLHVRHHLRQAVRGGSATAAGDLAMLFGHRRAEGQHASWREAASAATPIAAGAAVAASEAGEGVAALGHDPAHLRECHAWLRERKDQDDAFNTIIALDLSTLLALSRARDLATAHGRDSAGARRALPIVVFGETGTGKELLAKAIHTIWAREARRPQAKFHPLHLAGMPPNLIYDELFGHGEGAYTGARKARDGRLVSADGGTLLIDEVGDLPAEAQVALLRFLQDGSLSAIGRDEQRAVDVRIIAATWHDLAADQKAGRFRADLYHRLHAGSALRLEPLRGRRTPRAEVIHALLERKEHTASPPISRSALEALGKHDWPGNLRELDGVLDEAISMSRDTTIRLEHLPSQIVRAYLALPTHERPHGFLADDADDGPLTPELIAWRIDRAVESIHRHAITPGATESRRMSAFLHQLEDPSDAHEAALRDVDAAVGLEDEFIYSKTLEGMLEAVVQAPEMPAVVVDIASAALNDARGAQATMRVQVLEHLKRIDETHPWFRVFRDVAALPILQGRANTEVAQGIVFLVRTVASFWPEGLAILRPDAKKGAARELFEKITKMLPDNAATRMPMEPDLIADRKGAKDVTKEEWEGIVRENKSLTTATKTTGFDPKTIKKWLKAHGVVAGWGQAGTADGATSATVAESTVTVVDAE